MKTIAFYDAKPYDKKYFDKLAPEYGFMLKYIDGRLGGHSAVMANGCDGVCAFVNDDINEDVLRQLDSYKIHVLAMRSAGYNNVDFKAAFGRVHILRVPAYSPYAVAEHAMALLLTLNRKTHRAFNRTREHNFALAGLIGFDLHNKTVGVIGAGKIGQVFIGICRGFGMNVIAYDPFPVPDSDITYVPLDRLFCESDIISLHCPLTKETHHILNERTLSLMKEGVTIINTSRGALIDAEALLEAIRNHRVGSVGLDVYEEEADVFFEDFSEEILKDDTLLMLLSMPNVLVTGHQAFLTEEALENIAHTTLGNLKAYFEEKPLENEICYQCLQYGKCDRKHQKSCF